MDHVDTRIIERVYAYPSRASGAARKRRGWQYSASGGKAAARRLILLRFMTNPDRQVCVSRVVVFTAVGALMLAPLRQAYRRSPPLRP